MNSAAMWRAPILSATASACGAGRFAGEGRKKKAKAAGCPERRAKTEPTPTRPGARRVKAAPLLGGFDVGHRPKQKQQQLGIFEKTAAQPRLDLMREPKPG